MYYSISENETKKIVLVLLLGFVSYIVHGAINNFLDTDKASVPFWGFIAMLVSIDLYHTKSKPIEEMVSQDKGGMKTIVNEPSH